MSLFIAIFLNFQNFFRRSSLEIYKILQPMDIILDANIIIELPESLQCSNLSTKKMKLPLNSIDVIISGNQTKTLQHEGCGKKGYKILTSISESKGIFFFKSETFSNNYRNSRSFKVVLMPLKVGNDFIDDF